MTSETVTAERLVHDYLAALDAALAGTAVRPARALRTQVITHLHDALDPAASVQDVEFVLAQLGAPADLAAAARATAPGYPRARWHRRPLQMRRPRRGWLWLTWRAIPVLAVLAAAAYLAGWTVVWRHTPPLQPAGPTAWYFAQDARAARTTSADNHSQTTTPIRYGQQQGVAVLIRNPAGRAQSVLGSASYVFIDGGPVHVATAATGGLTAGNFRRARYAVPAVIPAHQSRWVRILWTSKTCVMPGGGPITDVLTLKVSTGWVTRTDTISLGRGFSLSGRPGPGCP